MASTDPPRAPENGEDDSRSRARAVVEGLQRGDPEAVAAVRSRVRRILSFRGYRIPGEDRKDLEQEAMTQIWTAVNRSSFESTGFWGFVDVVSTRRCIDWLRTDKPTMPLEPTRTDQRPDALAKLLTHERAGLAYATLARLDKPCRELIFLHAGLNKTYREISRILGKSEGALRVQMYRCVRAARKMLLEQARSADASTDSEPSENR